MQSVKTLSDRDFELKPRKTGGNILCCNLKGISLVMFKTSECPHCVNMGPVMMNLSRKIHSVQFAVVNITNFPNVLKASHNSISPINHVPFIVLYVNTISIY